MPAIATLSIDDGQATPAAHSFVPVTTTGSKAEWAERSAAVPSGFFNMTHEVVKPKSASEAWKIKINFYVPTLATVDGVSTVVRFQSSTLTLNIAQGSSLQERKDLLAYVANSLGNADIKTSIENIEPFY